MDRSTTAYQPRFAAFIATLTLVIGMPALAQVPVDSNGSPVASLGAADEKYADVPYESDVAPLTAAELEALVGPIALYPDDLVEFVLPASTYPLQIVQAARFLEAYKNDSTLEPDESWDESVIALINYPEVIQLLNDDIDWTWQLGEAVISQQEEIVAAVESFRDRAYVAGNLKSDEYQTVSREDDIIEIVPIEDDIIYVPYYEPESVVVYQPRPVYHYYARPYPVYYYPYPLGHAFSSGIFWGVTTAFRIGWATDHLHVHHASYWGHPYYGHHYYGHYYRRPSIAVYNTVYVNNARRNSTQRFRDGDYWRPHRRAGSRQSDYYAHTRHYRNDVQRVRNSNSRTVTTRGRDDDPVNTRRNIRTTSINDQRQRPATTAISDRRQRPANVNHDVRIRANSNASARRNQQETRQVARSSTNDRRQSEQRSQRQATVNNANRSREARPAQRQQARSEPSRSQTPASTRSERAPAQRSKKTERTTQRSRPERSSGRKERRTN